MGGVGSSRWRSHSKRRLVTEAMALDLRNPKLRTLLANDRAEGTLYWSDPITGNPRGWADFLLSPVTPDGTRNLVLHRTEDEFEPKQLVVLGLRPAGFTRQWFAGCRSCDRWVGTLFATSQHDLFRCRICSKLTYRSVQQHDARLDFARRDLSGLLAARAKAQKTFNSQSVTASLAFAAQDRYRRGRSWGRPFPTLEDPLPKSWIDEKRC